MWKGSSVLATAHAMAKEARFGELLVTCPGAEGGKQEKVGHAAPCEPNQPETTSQAGRQGLGHLSWALKTEYILAVVGSGIPGSGDG